MTGLAPPVVLPTAPPVGRAGRSGSLAWMTLPALVVFVAFAVVPLIGVVLLSFTVVGRHRGDLAQPAHQLDGVLATRACCTRCG